MLYVLAIAGILGFFYFSEVWYNKTEGHGINRAWGLLAGSCFMIGVIFTFFSVSYALGGSTFSQSSPVRVPLGEIHSSTDGVFVINEDGTGEFFTTEDADFHVIGSDEIQYATYEQTESGWTFWGYQGQNTTLFRDFYLYERSIPTED